MKPVYGVFGIVILIILAGCGGSAGNSPSPTTPPTTLLPTTVPPTNTPGRPTWTPRPTKTPTATPTYAPAVANITVGEGQCLYDGPDPFPAGDTMVVMVHFDNDTSLSGVMAVIAEEGITKDDMVKQLNSNAAVAPWYTPASMVHGAAHTSAQGALQNEKGGPLRGPMFLYCVTGLESSDAKLTGVLGPYDVK